MANEKNKKTHFIDFECPYHLDFNLYKLILKIEIFSTNL